MVNKTILSDEEKKERRREYSKRYREKNKDKVRESVKKYYEKNKDKLQEKMIEYGKEYYKKNKERYKKNHKKYYEENKEKMLNGHRKWRDENKEKLKEYHKKYEEENKEKISKKKKEYRSRPEVKERNRISGKKHDDKRRKDPIFRFNQNISRSINLSLKKNNLSKNGRHWEDLVGYTSQELRDHLEKLFQSGMTWDNRGLWHIDHIIPKSFFKIKEVGDPEFRICWRLENLQPLWAVDNIRKKNRIVFGRM